MGLVTNGSFVSILGNGNDFSVTVKNREITVIREYPKVCVNLQTDVR